jgi:hypothetical protein
MRRSWPLDEYEFARMVNEAAWPRYVYFVKRTANWGLVWLLADESGYAQYLGDDGYNYLGVWPHEDYARLCRGTWSGLVKPVSLPTGVFAQEFLRRSPKDRTDGLRYNVFPLPSSKGYLSEGIDLHRDLRAEKSTSRADAPWSRDSAGE